MEIMRAGLGEEKRRGPEILRRKGPLLRLGEGVGVRRQMQETLPSSRSKGEARF